MNKFIIILFALMGAIVLAIGLSSCRDTSKKKVRAKQLVWSTNSNYIEVMTISLIEVDTMYHINDTIWYNSDRYKIIN